ncbi:MAG: dihydroneopterin aldolase [Chitinophagales bacterium]|nr:dihydroneopterin aldolase [Chitinophagales bacterium]
MTLIALEGLRFNAAIGHYQEEQVLKNTIMVDIYLEISDSTFHEEALESTINYEQVYFLVKEIMLLRMELLETVCNRIINTLNKTFPAINALKVRVGKLHPSIHGIIEKVYVQKEWVRE